MLMATLMVLCTCVWQALRVLKQLATWTCGWYGMCIFIILALLIHCVLLLCALHNKDSKDCTLLVATVVLLHCYGKFPVSFLMQLHDYTSGWLGGVV